MKANQIGKRIKEIRKDQGLTQIEFGSQIGVKGNTITGYENGTRSPSDAVISNICLVFNVNQTWLRTGDAGEGEKYITAPEFTSPLEQLFNDRQCNNLEIKFLNAYFGLKLQERKSFCELIVKMFPDSISQIVGDDPLGSSYDILFQEAPPLSEDEVRRNRHESQQQKKPTPVSEDGQEDELEAFIRKHKANLTVGQEQQILEMMQAMIASQKPPLSASAQQIIDEKDPKTEHQGQS